MPRINKKDQAKPVKSEDLVTVTGGLSLSNLEIPDHLRPRDSLMMGERGFVYITLADGTDFPVDRGGLNFSIKKDSLAAIEQALEEQASVFIENKRVYQVVSGDGKNVRDYSAEEGSELARFMQGVPYLKEQFYNHFIEVK